MEKINIDKEIEDILNQLKKNIKRPSDIIGIQGQIKILKDNMLHILDSSKSIANLAKSKAIGEATSSIESMEKEQEKIRKEVLTFAVFGQMGSGKSSFLNTIAREKLLNVSEQRTTSTISVIRHIENFDGYKNGDIEVNYKSKQKLYEELCSSINQFNEYSGSDIETPDNIDDFFKQENKDKILNIINNNNIYTEINRKYRNEARGLGKKLEYFLDGIECYKNNIDTNQKIYKLSNELIDDKKSVFIDKVIFYKDIEFLKGIELVDTPGFGSNNNLHTNTSEKFIKEADVVLILTDAKEPMQKESELDILNILQDIDKENKGNSQKTIFEKVFIVINKIDTAISNREEILSVLNNELKDKHITNIPHENILFISSIYEYQKALSWEGLINLNLLNINNIGEDDLGILERRIYTFTSKEMTEIFISNKIANMETILHKSIEYFNNSIEDLKRKVEVVEKEINNEKKSQKNTKENAEEEFIKGVKNAEANLSGELGESLKTNIDIYGTNKYFKEMTNKIRWKNIKENKEKRFRELAKEESIRLINNLIYHITEDFIKAINQKVEYINSLFKKYREDMQKIIKEENNISIECNSIEPFKSIEMHFDRIDEKLFERGLGIKIKQFLNPFVWGEVEKEIDSASERYEDICKDSFSESMSIEIKTIMSRFMEEIKIQKEENDKNIEESLKIQLNEKERYKIMNEEEQKSHIRDKESITEAFKSIERVNIKQIIDQKDYIFIKENK